MNRIVKRDGSIVTFDANKIEQAILKAAKVTKEFTESEASKITNKVILMAQEIANKKESNLKAATVEEVQDAVEIALYSFGYTQTADLTIVIGANDVLNPAAREAEGTPIQRSRSFRCSER